jgi:hypothetical protein
MSTGREEYMKHRERMQSIVAYDVEDKMQSIAEKNLAVNAIQAQMEVCKKRLIEIGIQTYESMLNDLLVDLRNKNEITEDEMSEILRYIKNQMSSDDRSITTKLACNLIIEFNSHRKEREIMGCMPSNIKESIQEELAYTAFSVNQYAIRNNAEYQRLKKEFKDLDQMKCGLEVQIGHESQVCRAKIEPENLNTQELKNLCNQIGNKNIEILIIKSEDSMNLDLASVIQMRTKSALSKGNELILMTVDTFHSIALSNDIHGVDKLSFLHHGDIEHEFGYAQHIQTYINHMPQLREIVLRGCGTAENPAYDKKPVYTAKVMPYDKPPSFQGDETSQLIIQQEQREDKLYTKVSWKEIDPATGNLVIIEKNTTSLRKIDGKKPTDQQLLALEQIEGMPLLKHGSDYVRSMRDIFFSENKEISRDELTKVKKALPRARTESATHSEKDLLAKILNNMTPEQRTRVSVKAYVGGYHVMHGRVRPDTGHDRNTEPKAARVGPKFSRSGAERKPR